ncbi:MAG TPA: hypothetical protein PLJ21_10885, partial [Pseudobdellovibrionaceae bacterium]|nr:hypothetical protein [Pseudobdellovibrionaceae bacterium]
AKTFSNSYISFELPPSWNCILEQTEWVCRSTQTNESKEAIIILTAKEVGPLDKFELYLQHLSSPIKATSKTGELFQSQVKIKPDKTQIQGHIWLDSLHMNSEVQDYFTRYIVTTKEKIAVLVTFSSHKNFYAKYSQEFNRIIQSINIKSTKNIMKDIAASSGFSGSLGSGKDSGILMSGLGTDIPPPKRKTSPLFIFLGGLLVLFIIYFFIKKKPKKRRK